MDWTNTEKKDGYSIWENSVKEQYIVPDGLDPNQIHELRGIELFMTQHYTFFEIAYWLLIFAVFTYVIMRHILIPLWQRKAHSKALFSDE